MDLADARTCAQVRPERIDGQMGYYSFDAGTPITAGTWRAAQASADVALTGGRAARGRRARGGVRAVPPAGPPCRRRSLWRLLLSQQRRDRGPVPDRRRRRAGRDPRCRLPPRQRHAGDLLRPPGRAVPLAARRSARGVSRSSSAGPTSPAPAPARATTSTIRCRAAPALPPGPRPSTMPAARRRLRARTCSWCRSASTPSRTIRSRSSASRATTSPAYGARIAKLGLPTLFVMEGGYAVEQIGVNAVNVLQGFEGAEPPREAQRRVSISRPRQGSPGRRGLARRSRGAAGRPTAEPRHRRRVAGRSRAQAPAVQTARPEPSGRIRVAWSSCVMRARRDAADRQAASALRTRMWRGPMAWTDPQSAPSVARVHGEGRARLG